MELIDLFSTESKLLHDTSIAMIKLKKKAKSTKVAIDLWKGELSEGRMLTQEQCNVVQKRIQKWFEDEEEIKDLYDKWGKFHKDAVAFDARFRTPGTLEMVCTKRKN